MEIALLILGIIAGATIGWLAARSKYNRPGAPSEEELHRAESETESLRTEKAVLESKIEDIKAAERENAAKKAEAQAKITELTAELASVKERNSSLREKLAEQKEELERIQKKFEAEFENLATRILDTTAEKFTKQNKEKLENLISPFKEKIEKFRAKVEEIYDEENRQRASLKTEVKNLLELNQQLSKDATNLTAALKGDSKTMGDWGEVILERLLEESGLRKGEEFFIQKSFRTEDGKLQRPDVVVRFPQGRTIVIDSKVSLTAYERFSSAETDDERSAAMGEHLISVRKHIDELAGKDYQKLQGLESLDYVLMFIPVEPAYLTAIREDPGLWKYAYDKGISLISPTNLVAILKMTYCLWQLQRQTDNAAEIASRGGALYDKFVNFAESMEDIGKYLEKSREAYDTSMNRLRDGRGSLTRQVEMLRELGADTKKKVPREMLEEASAPELEEGGKIDSEGIDSDLPESLL